MKALFIFLFSLFSQIVFADSKSAFDVSVSSGQLYTAAVAYQRIYDVGLIGGLRLGWIARATHASKDNSVYETAPANIRRGKSDWLSGLTASEVSKNIDDLKVENTQATFAGIGYVLEYQATQSFCFGHSLDVFGFTYGPDSEATYTPNPERGSSTPVTRTRAKPTSRNILLLGDNDIGSLNSDFYVSYRITKDYSIRAGLAYTFVEYKTEQKFDFGNDRFRFKSSGLLVAVKYGF